MVFALGMSFEIGAVEVDFAQIAGAVAFCLIVEMGRGGVAAFSAGSDCFRVDFVAELNDRDEAVSAGAVPFFCSGVGASSDRGGGSPEQRGDAAGDVCCRVME